MPQWQWNDPRSYLITSLASGALDGWAQPPLTEPAPPTPPLVATPVVCAVQPAGFAICANSCLVRTPSRFVSSTLNKSSDGLPIDIGVVAAN
mmetsp:Transcript_52757/g.123389  ORF Transcript_52757/g.123389 Transcript_52757/m.123389 type:complete len:92 (+) Transcript_52757:27-302(+)